MSARVLNPAMMTEISRNLGGGGRASPSKAALARVRRDLFGPVDHAAARALAERELHTQSLLDAERWGFDFHLEIPRPNSRYEWEPVTEHDVVPEPYALRGMPYLREHAPGTPQKLRASDDDDDDDDDDAAAVVVSSTAAESTSPTTTSLATTSTTLMTTTTMITTTRIIEQMEAGTTPTVERTPPQEPRVPEIGDAARSSHFSDTNKKKRTIEPTTPVLPPAARKQPVITDFMKSRKRSLNGTTKSMIEPPEKITRNAGQIRS
ncbi:uncharacterized protein LOC109863979 [Pseudomyrmex gracilis]|uniref:uncharacterized protein LOC109863979 n=1 Tax=Pseudomyrmex gracilis TaxID=219809 RepID=UPI00099562D4|nr:uncharacterized protein LOC109863979 [Pseudomyrmex gracilis]